MANNKNGNRAYFNTTVDKNVLEEFKETCSNSGIPMGVLIESFMRQYVNGEFCLRIGKNKKIEVDIDDGTLEKLTL